MTGSVLPQWVDWTELRPSVYRTPIISMVGLLDDCRRLSDIGLKVERERCAIPCDRQFQTFGSYKLPANSSNRSRSVLLCKPRSWTAGPDPIAKFQTERRYKRTLRS